MTRTLKCSLLVLVSLSLYAQPSEREHALQQAQDFLKLAPQAQKEAAQKLSSREAEALKTQILALRGKKNPDLVSLEYVITQLSTISALQVAQTRLNSLLWTIVLTFVLLVIFLGYILYDQRRILAMLAARAAQPAPAQTEPQPSRTSSRSPSRKSKR